MIKAIINGKPSAFCHQRAQVSAMSAMIMSGIFIIGLFYRARTRLYRTVGWASLMLLSVCLINSYILFIYGG